MIVRILDSALEDLDRGRSFYERQGEGLGAYSLDSLYSEIDSLVLFAGKHRKVVGYHRLLAKRFPYAIYLLSSRRRICRGCLAGARSSAGPFKDSASSEIKANKRLHANAAIALLFHSERHWRGVGEFCR